MQSFFSDHFTVNHVFHGFVETADFLADFLESLSWVRNLVEILKAEQLSPILDSSSIRLNISLEFSKPTFLSVILFFIKFAQASDFA